MKTQLVFTAAVSAAIARSHIHTNAPSSPSFLSPSVEAPKEERPELQKKTYKWNTKEEAKQAFKELLKEKVSPVKQV